MRYIKVNRVLFATFFSSFFALNGTSLECSISVLSPETSAESAVLCKGTEARSWILFELERSRRHGRKTQESSCSIRQHSEKMHLSKRDEREMVHRFTSLLTLGFLISWLTTKRQIKQVQVQKFIFA